MTRDEAVNKLNWVSLRINEDTFSPEANEAIRMAIRSLEAWEDIIESIRNLGGEFYSADTREIIESIEEHLKEVEK